MRKIIRFIFIVLVLGALFQLDLTGALSSLDNMQKEWKFTLLQRPASGEVVLVEIDAASLNALDVWPWPREYHAKVLNNLMEMGANEVAFDIDFSSRSNADGDQAFAQALEDAGGYAFLAAFDQLSGITRDLIRSEPTQALAEHAEPILVNVDLDRDGRAVSFPTQSAGDAAKIESLATTLGYPEKTPPSHILFDYRINIDQIDRISFVDLYENLVDAERVRNKQIVIGASAIELRDFFDTPRFGVIPGPLLQILALETVKSNRVLIDLGTWPSLLVAIIGALIGILIKPRIGLTGLAIFSVIWLLAFEASLILVLEHFNYLAATHLAHMAVPIILVLELLSDALTWFTQRRALRNRLQYLARYDQNTGVFSRAGFTERMQTNREKAGATTLILVAIARLDQVRDALGDKIANLTLKNIAERLEQKFDGEIGLVRQDILCIGLDRVAPAHELEKFQEQLEFEINTPIEIEGHNVIVGVKIAAAQSQRPTQSNMLAQKLEPAPSEDAKLSIDNLLTDAHIALDEAGVHETQPGQMILYAPIFAQRISERRKMDVEMRKAIQRDELRVAFQPQVNLKTRQMVGVEALVRWQSEDLGRVNPGVFVGLAEETGYVVEIGKWVMDEACRIIALWDWDGTISVNVSPAQFELSDVPQLVRSALDQSGLAPQRLCVEVTESVLLHGADETISALERIRSQGGKVALDDFGTGYSSLSYLNVLPFDELKIDQSFVRNLEEKPANRAIIEAVISMAHKMGKHVVAEGVETEGEAEWLNALHCDIGQGYLFARPVDARTITAALARTGG